jgi:predicted dehydrogenase
MTSADDVRVGVVGCGYWGSKHVRVMHGTPAVAGLVLIDGRKDRLQGLQRMYPGALQFPDLQSALPFVDAIVVATPPGTHVPVALEAIRAGKHVLVEKPLAPSSAGARRLIEAADRSGVVLMVGHTFEYNPAVWKLREIVNNRQLGRVYYLDSARLSLGLYQNDVNVIMDLAPHDISIANHVLGVRPTAIQAWAARHADPSFEDVAYLRLFYDDPCLSATIHVSWLDPCKVRRVTVVGSDKMAVYDDLAAEERVRIIDKGVSARLDEAPGVVDLTQPPMSYRYGDIVAPFIAADEPLAVQDRHFIECVSMGLTPLTDGASGLAVVRILEAAQLSLRLGHPVALDDESTDSPRMVCQVAGNGHSHLKSPTRTAATPLALLDNGDSHAVA